jgi:hypothetical protein
MAAAAAAAAAATAAKEAAAKVERAMAEMKLKTEREAAAAAQKRREAEAIAAASFELSAMFDKALSHLGIDAHVNASLGGGGGGGAAVANRVENVVELHETLLDLCSKAEALTARAPQIKSVAKIVEPCLMRLLEAINKNRESGELLWLDDATPRTRQSFNRCKPSRLVTNARLSHTLSYVFRQYSQRVAAAGDRPLRGAIARQHIEEVDSSADVHG